MATYAFGCIVTGGSLPLRTDRHFLGGKITVNGAPAKKRIVVIDRTLLIYRGSTWSDATTGEWTLPSMEEHEPESLLVLAFDENGNYNAEAADHISQVATAV